MSLGFGNQNREKASSVCAAKNARLLHVLSKIGQTRLQLLSQNSLLLDRRERERDERVEDLGPAWLGWRGGRNNERMRGGISSLELLGESGLIVGLMVGIDAIR